MPAEKERGSFNDVLSALADAFEKEGRAGGTLAAIRLRDSLDGTYRRTAPTSDPGPLLDAACGLIGAHSVAATVLSCRSILDWMLWEGEGLAADISSRLFIAELVGPDGHIAADDVRVGLLISDAGTDYPVSSHSGEETYLVRQSGSFNAFYAFRGLP